MRRPAGKIGLRALGAGLGALLSLAMVASVFFRWNAGGTGPWLAPRFSFAQFGRDLFRNLGWVGPFVLLTAAMAPLRAVQWQFTLGRKVPLAFRYHLVAVAGLANNAFPGKLGDLLRAVLLARSEKIPFIESLGSVAVCKLLEFAALMLLLGASFAGPVAPSLQPFAGALQAASAVCIALVAAVVVLAHSAAPLARALARRQGFAALQHFLANVSRGLGTARSIRGMAVALLFSLGPVLSPAIAYGLGLRALGIRGGLLGGAVVLGALSLGQTAAAPVSLGVYYLVCAWATRGLGASPEQAAAYALITHLATVLTQVGMGALSLPFVQLRWSDLRRQGKAAAAELKQLEKRPVGVKT